MVLIVRYKWEYYCWYNTTSNGNAKLLNSKGEKFSGTPSPKKLTVIKALETKSFNNHTYFSTKLGVFSASTGNEIVDTNITSLFE